MASPSMETIYQAITALYDNPDVNEKEKASLWLGEVQKSIHSWTVADELLQQKRNLQSCYFAAQTMRSKVQHNLSELPAESLASLRDSLVSHLEATAPDTSGAILTQLSLALADLALQMPSWQNCVSDLIKKFSTKNDFALLEVLTVLPQEVDSSSLKLGENRRENVKTELRMNSLLVCNFLKENITNTQNSNIALKIIKCMTSWIQVRAINIQEIPQNAVIGYCLQILRDHNSVYTLHEASGDCLCSLLHCIEENNNCEDVERLLFDSVSALENSYHMAVAHEEEEKALNYARVFTELAESFLCKIVMYASAGNTHFAMRSLELVLVCVGHHDYEVAEITFNLWYRLSEEVYERDYQPLTEMFRPHVQRLVAALARHCQCEPDQLQLPDEGDEFYDFRLKVMELIKDVVFIVGSSSVFRQMFAALHEDISWEQTEAALFVMQAVAKNILPEEYEVVPKVVEAILSMPDNTHAAVRKTCVLLLGELCEWIDRHPECLEPCLQSLLKALQDQRLASAAAVALQSICKACRGHMGVHVAGLLQLARGLDALPLGPDACTALLRGLAAIIGHLPGDQMSVAMREATAVQLAALSELVECGAGDAKKGSSGDPVRWLDRIAALFRDVEARGAAGPEGGDHPCMAALVDAWPVLARVMDKYQSNGRVLERLCRALRFAVRCTGRHAAPLLVPFAHKMAAVYSQHQHSCLLYLASILVDELAAESACVRPLLDLLQALMPRAFDLLQKENGLKDNPDTVDDLFRLCIRFLQRTPLELVSSGALAAAVQCARLACSLDHRDANASVMKFLFDLARAASSTTNARNDRVKALTDAALSSYGEELTFALLEAAVLHLHSYMLSEVAEVVLELLQWRRSSAEQWLRSALQKLPRDLPATPADQQCLQFYQYAVRAETCKEMTKLLRDFARLYR